MSELRVVRITTLAEMEEALAVRQAVFVQEQKVPIEIEIDEHDGDPAAITTALHVLGRAGDRAVATGRLLLDDASDAAHIGRVAVLAEHRERGWGLAVMEGLHSLAREQSYKTILLSAQLHALAFYERLDYVPEGDIFLEAGIEHRDMRLRL